MFFKTNVGTSADRCIGFGEETANWGLEMRRSFAVVAVAVLIFGSVVTVCGKVQSKDDVIDGHHNAIVGDGVKINKNNNVPYGQIKKTEDERGSTGQGAPLDESSGTVTGAGAIGGAIIQVANLDSQILGGHHNSIILESCQSTGLSGICSEGLFQGSYIDSLIDGGHHNLIFVDSSQIALIDGSGSDLSSGDLIQMADVSGQIVGGHHNTIVVGSFQEIDTN